MLHLIQVHLMVQTLYPEWILTQETWEQVDQVFSVQHVVSIHTGVEVAHMTIYAPHVIVMIMLHTCAGPQVQNLVLLSVFIVAALTTGLEIAPINLGTTGNNQVEHLMH